MSPEEVAALFEAVPDASGLGDGGEGAALSYHELAATKRQLGGVLDTCSRLWEAKNPVLDAVAEKIGDGVRNGESLVRPALPDTRRHTKHGMLR